MDEQDKHKQQHDRRELREYPLGTRAYAHGGGYWIRVKRGWKWLSRGSTFPSPGGDWNGIISLPRGTR